MSSSAEDSAGSSDSPRCCYNIFGCSSNKKSSNSNINNRYNYDSIGTSDPSSSPNSNYKMGTGSSSTRKVKSPSKDRGLKNLDSKTKKSIMKLHNQFPQWDEYDLMSVLEQHNNDEAKSKVFIMGSCEQNDDDLNEDNLDTNIDSKDVLVNNNKPSSHATAISNATSASSPYKDEPVIVKTSQIKTSSEVLSQPFNLMQREFYDSVMSSRLKRRLSMSSSDTLASLVKVKNQMGKKAEEARERVKEKKELSAQQNPNNDSHSDVINNNKKISSNKSKKDPNRLSLRPLLNNSPADQSGTQLLHQRLSFLSMKTVVSDGDGNCQFRSLSRELYGKQGYYKIVRKIVIDYMKKDLKSKKELLPFVGEDDDDYEEYIENMSRDRSWGDELTLRACSDAFGVEIYVVTTEKDNWLLHYEPSGSGIGGAVTGAGPSGPKRICFLSYISPVHYNSIAPLK